MSDQKPDQPFDPTAEAAQQPVADSPGEPNGQPPGPAVPETFAAAPPPPPPPAATGPTPPPPTWYGQQAPPAAGPQFPAAPVGVPTVDTRYAVPSDVKNLALISTLGMLIGGFISPLIVYLVTNDDPQKRFANDHAKEGLNFSIAFYLVTFAVVILSFVFIGFILIPFLIGWWLWVIIAGAIQANNGEAPHYPLVPKIIK